MKRKIEKDCYSKEQDEYCRWESLKRALQLIEEGASPEEVDEVIDIYLEELYEWQDTLDAFRNLNRDNGWSYQIEYLPENSESVREYKRMRAEMEELKERTKKRIEKEIQQLCQSKDYVLE